MKTLRLYLFSWLFILSSCNFLFGQQVSVKRIAVLPFYSNGVDQASTQSAESILRLEISKLGTMDIVSEKRTLQYLHDTVCTDIDCAVKIGKELNADQVVICKLGALGEKVIVEYLLVDVSAGKSIIEDRITASYVEDLDAVMKRVAMSIVKHEPVVQTAEVGAITENEAKIPPRRGSRRFSGFSFGYLYPQHGYDNSDRSFSMDFRTGAEFQDYAIGMQLLLRRGFGANVFVSYLSSRKDFCPYIGGAFGFHWISHEYHYYYGYEEDKKKGDGFEFAVNSGFRFFHTYNFQIIINLGYTYTLNDFHDQGVVFTIGLLH